MAEGGRMQDPSGELTITGAVQREAWLQRAMPPAEQLGPDLWSLPVPIPDNPLRYVSVYAFGTGEGLVLIDAGWPTCPAGNSAPCTPPATPPGTCVSWTSGRAGCSPAITCCPGSPPTSPSSATLLPT